MSSALTAIITLKKICNHPQLLLHAKAAELRALEDVRIAIGTLFNVEKVKTTKKKAKEESEDAEDSDNETAGDVAALCSLLPPTLSLSDAPSTEVELIDPFFI